MRIPIPIRILCLYLYRCVYVYYACTYFKGRNFRRSFEILLPRKIFKEAIRESLISRKTLFVTLVIFLKSKLSRERRTKNIPYPNVLSFYLFLRDIKMCHFTVYFCIQKCFLQYFLQFWLAR